MTVDQKALARRGAVVRLEELHGEIERLERERDRLLAFVGVPLNGSPPAAARAALAVGLTLKAANVAGGKAADRHWNAARAAAPPARKKRRYTKAERAAFGRRMRAYWRARRKIEPGAHPGPSGGG